MQKQLDEDEAMLERLRVPESPSRKGAKRSRERFVMMSHQAAMAGCRALGCPAFIVWHYIHYRVWAEGAPTVSLPNQALADMGVTRDTKRRALRRLERAGLIRIASQGNYRSPLVTLL